MQTYNTLIQVFPAVIVARGFGFGRREFFDAPASRRGGARGPLLGDRAAQARRVSPRRRRRSSDAPACDARRGCAAALLALAPAARAESSDVVDADVHLELANDASLLVTERLTFDYDGTFEGSYRDITCSTARRSPTSR